MVTVVAVPSTTRFTGGGQADGAINENTLLVYHYMRYVSVYNSIRLATSLPDHPLPVNRIWVRDTTTKKLVVQTRILYNTLPFRRCFDEERIARGYRRGR